MAFCSQCGANAVPGASFCASCGGSLLPTGPTPLGTAISPESMTQRPTGTHRTPGSVLLLTLITLGFYQVYYWWTVSKETDLYAATPGRAHRPIRIGLFVIGGVSIAGVLLGMAMMATIFAGTTGDPEETTMAALGTMMVLTPPLIVGIVVGGILFLVGQWRVWQTIEADERRRNAEKPLSPLVQLVLTIIPYVSLVTVWIALWRTQDHLNRMWARTP